MIEIKEIDKNDNPLLREVITKEEQKEKVIKSATVPKWDPSSFKTVRELHVTNIFNDDGDFVIEVDTSKYPTCIKVSRDLVKKMIYDIYLN